jgi:hypothetical protein
MSDQFFNNLRSVTCFLMILYALTVLGCGSEGNNATDYASFQPGTDEVAFEVHDIDPKDVAKIREALESIPGIDKSSIRIHPEGELITFKVTDSSTETSVAKKVQGVLRELELEVRDGFKIKP